MSGPAIFHTTIERLKRQPRQTNHVSLTVDPAAFLEEDANPSRTTIETTPVAQETIDQPVPTNRNAWAIQEHTTSHSSTPLCQPIQDSPNTAVAEIPISKLDGCTVRIEGRATPGRFRLLDCTAFLDSRVLRIVEFSKFSPQDLRFAAISYPWRDLQLPEGTKAPEGSFLVHGAEHADPITIAVLRTACIATRYFGASFFWLDRLCIIQSSKEDKNWQIQRMYTIYLHCNLCLVLPGGLVRLAGLDERTSWTDRAWTLQEAAASLDRDVIKCIFSFPHSDLPEFVQSLPDMGYTDKFKDYLAHRNNFIQDILEPRISASCDLLKLFRHINFTYKAFEVLDSKSHSDLPIRIIPTPAVRLLRNSIRSPNSINYRYFWMSAFTRSSSRPVDMVFSIMGPMGVSLNVAEFDPSDRVKATIKLIQALLQRGRPADWLFIAPELPPSPELSILPTFPETSVSGRAMLCLPHGRIPASEAIGMAQAWETGGAPTGEMTDDGYFHFRAKSVQIHDPAYASEAETWGIIVGRRRELNRNPETGLVSTSPDGKRFPERIELTFMFVEKHGFNDGQELFHRVGMEHEISETETLDWAWVEREFNVGGLGKGERVRFAVEKNGGATFIRFSEMNVHS